MPKRLLSAASILVIQSFICAAVMAKTVVVHATGPSTSRFPVGLILREPLVLQLREGDRVRVLDAKGTRELRGPATIDDRKPSVRSEKAMLTWAELTGQERRVEAGGVRGLDGVVAKDSILSKSESAQDELWQIDVAKGGRWCVLESSRARFWRANSSQNALLKISERTGSRSFSWPAGEQSLDVSLAQAARESSFEIAYAGTALSIQLGVIERFTSLKDLADLLRDRGCVYQVGLLTSE